MRVSPVGTICREKNIEDTVTVQDALSRDDLGHDASCRDTCEPTLCKRGQNLMDLLKIMKEPPKFSTNVKEVVQNLQISP